MNLGKHVAPWFTPACPSINTKTGFLIILVNCQQQGFAIELQYGHAYNAFTMSRKETVSAKIGTTATLQVLQITQCKIQYWLRQDIYTVFQLKFHQNSNVYKYNVTQQRLTLF